MQGFQLPGKPVRLRGQAGWRYVRKGGALSELGPAGQVSYGRVCMRPCVVNSCQELAAIS